MIAVTQGSNSLSKYFAPTVDSSWVTGLEYALSRAFPEMSSHWTLSTLGDRCSFYPDSADEKLSFGRESWLAQGYVGIT